MKYLLDTHLLLWAAVGAAQLPQGVRAILDDEANTPVFSAASVWEVAIKSGLSESGSGKRGLSVDPRTFRRSLIEAGYVELEISSAHTVGVAGLPPIHRDPFDRILVAQAIAEGITLLTADRIVARYPGPIERL